MRDLTFIEIVENIEALKDQYGQFLVSFFNQKPGERVIHIRDFRSMVYAFKIKEWQKDRIWEALNDDITLEELINIANHTY